MKLILARHSNKLHRIFYKIDENYINKKKKTKRDEKKIKLKKLFSEIIQVFSGHKANA